jgi:hypothetical protein
VQRKALRAKLRKDRKATPRQFAAKLASGGAIPAEAKAPPTHCKFNIYE